MNNAKVFKFFISIIAFGIIAALALWWLSARTPNIKPIVSSYNECVAAGYPVMESYPQRCKTADGRAFIQDIGNEFEKQNLIRVDSPRPNQIVASPLNIMGQARGTWFFEATFPVKMLDAKGKVVGQYYAQAQGEWMTEEFVPFIVALEFSGAVGERGTLVLEKDNPSGLPKNADELHIPIVFGQSQTIEVSAYFTTLETAVDPDFDCRKVAPVSRTVPKIEAIARVALEQLLLGPTAEERGRGFGTSLPSEDIQIQSLVIENGAARVDFNEALERGVGGSCRVASIRAQIEATLKQFPSVQTVIISIDGRTEDILQP